MRNTVVDQLTVTVTVSSFLRNFNFHLFFFLSNWINMFNILQFKKMHSNHLFTKKMKQNITSIPVYY